MNSDTRRAAFADRVDSIAYHLEGMRELIAALPEDPAHAVPGTLGSSFEDVALLTFAHWTLDLLGFPEGGDVSDQVREARRRLVVAMARNSPTPAGPQQRQEPFEPTPGDFHDLFEGEEIEEAPELDIDPIDGLDPAV